MKRLLTDLHYHFHGIFGESKLTKNVCVYLRPPVKDCMHRMYNRYRESELRSVKEEYQKSLQDIHDNFLLKRKDLVLIDTDMNFITDNMVRIEMVEKIIAKM